MTSIRHVRQPKPSNLCGQACVAMVMGINLLDAIGRMRTRGPTRTRQIAAALKDSGRFDCDDRLTRIGKDFTAPPLAIMKVSWKEGKRRRGHWVVWHHGWWFDPADEQIRKGTDGLRAPPGWKVTSYLEIREAEHGEEETPQVDS